VHSEKKYGKRLGSLNVKNQDFAVDKMDFIDDIQIVENPIITE